MPRPKRKEIFSKGNPRKMKKKKRKMRIKKMGEKEKK